MPASQRRRILVISASMGAGHDGAARELARRLEIRGHVVRVVDFLDALPLRLGGALRSLYALELRIAPWSYEWLFRVWYLLPWLWSPLVALDTALAARRVRRWAKSFRADAVVSTYPLASLVLGRLRRKGRLHLPTATFITDFTPHPLWVHPDVDAHLCVHPESALDVTQRAGRSRVTAPGPMVPARFGAPEVCARRAATRERLGIAPGARVVLVVAGSWGVGEVERTVAALAAAGRFVPVTVCGRDTGLRERLERAGHGIPLGWVDDMPELMAASDALVENAGGLTSMEALAAGLPVVTYQPIPGHGRANADRMAAAGVTAFPSDPPELVAVLDRLTHRTLERARAVRAGHDLFSGDAAADVADLAAAGPVPHRLRVGMVARRAAVASVAGLMLYTGATFGVGTAAAHGLGVAHPARAGFGPAFVGVRLDRAELATPEIYALLAQLHATAVVHADALSDDPGLVTRLSLGGVGVALCDWGVVPPRVPTGLGSRPGHVLPPTMLDRIGLYVPQQRLDVLDLLRATFVHRQVVIPEAVIRRPGALPELGAGRTYLVDGPGFTPAQLEQLLRGLADQARADHLRLDPYSAVP